MSYEKHTWETGEVITADKLNNMEDGVGDAQRFIVTITTEDDENYTADKTFTEILEAYTTGKEIIAALVGEETPGVVFYFLKYCEPYEYGDFIFSNCSISNDTHIGVEEIAINYDNSISFTSATI